jgi:alkylation response protein AidB-like acyl-CoA dehydrogenase
MQFELTEEHLMIRQAARDFAQTELKPGVIERDEHQKFPAEQIKKLGELGFFRHDGVAQYGGSGMDAISYVLVMEELSKVDASASVVVSVNNSLVCYGLEKYGNEEQKQKYLVPLSKGRKDRRLLPERTRSGI